MAEKHYAWYAKNDDGAIIGCWDTDQRDEEFDEFEDAWYFDIYRKSDNGLYFNEDGGIFYDYFDAKALCEDLGFENEASEEEFEKAQNDESFQWRCANAIYKDSGSKWELFGKARGILETRFGIGAIRAILTEIGGIECRKVLDEYRNDYFAF